jgi:uncharacterized protein YecT (DUF1311 family)
MCRVSTQITGRSASASALNSHSGQDLMLQAQPAWLAAQAETETLLGRDGMNAISNIKIRLADLTSTRPLEK